MISRKSIGLSASLSLCFLAMLFCFNLTVEAQTAKSVEEIVKSISGDTLQVETKATPYKLVADFDGDKIKDVAVIVRLSDTVKNIAKNVKIEYPYYFGKDKIDTELLALFIIHGKGKGWQFAQKSSVLLLGRSSALIFQKERLNETGDGMKLEKDKRGRTGIYLITEGADGTIKWNGKKYTWTESQP
ncbi:MAG: hypothetical protein ACR2HG_15030 [Pyrinomonadaceae bacterium]